MDTAPRSTRHWDVAPFLVLGVVLGVLGTLVDSGAGALMSLAGFALLLFGLVRWVRHPRRDGTARANVGMLADR